MSHAPILQQAPHLLRRTAEGDNPRTQEELGGAFFPSRYDLPQTEGYEQGKQSIHIPVVFEGYQLFRKLWGKQGVFLGGPRPRGGERVWVTTPRAGWKREREVSSGIFQRAEPTQDMPPHPSAMRSRGPLCPYLV